MKEKMKSSSTGMLRANGNKLPVTLNPLEAHFLGSAIYGFGASKYDKHNWRKGTNWSECADCLTRHLVFWLLGEDNDPDAKVNHLLNMQFNINSLIVMWATKTGTDDRHKLDPGQLAALRTTIDETSALMFTGIQEYTAGKRAKLHKQLASRRKKR